MGAAMEQDMKYIYQVYQDGSFSAAAGAPWH